MTTRTRSLAVLAVAALLAACGGSSGGGSSGGAPAPAPAPPAPPPTGITKPEAFRFLNQATMGATEAEANRVIALGYEGWINEQFMRPVSLQLPHIQSIQPPPQNIQELQRDRVDIWVRNAIDGQDQLRQRVAFALSEIMVVSQVGALANLPYSVGSYYDLLATRGLGNYRDLIEAVTLHPAMGVYLSMLGNQRPNPAANIRPDENYARELMQLFTIGLVELDLDGTVRLDGAGQPIPTYTQPIIEGFAHAYTGWTYANAPNGNFLQARPTAANQVVPMQLYPDFHDVGPKLVLGGVTIPANQTGAQDLDAALDNIFAHPNVGPFIARRLIQRLTTSNPSRDYVRRVAQRFNDNGRGVRGDLAVVVAAILLDPEARTASTATTGKLKEPLLRLTQLWRAYGGRAANGSYATSNLPALTGQGPLQAPSVFNFFSPFYAPPGEIRDAGLVAPELEIATEYQNTVFTNALAFQAFARNSRSPGLRPQDVVIDIEAEIAAAVDVTALVNLVADKLLAGQISPVLRAETTALITMIPASDVVNRAAEAVYLIGTSPEFALQP